MNRVNSHVGKIIPIKNTLGIKRGGQELKDEKDANKPNLMAKASFC